MARLPASAAAATTAARAKRRAKAPARSLAQGRKAIGHTSGSEGEVEEHARLRQPGDAGRGQQAEADRGEGRAGGKPAEVEARPRRGSCRLVQSLGIARQFQ